MPGMLMIGPQRDFIREVLETEIPLRTNGTEFVPKEKESKRSIQHRDMLNAEGSPTNTVSAGYLWTPGTELSRRSSVADKGN